MLRTIRTNTADSIRSHLLRVWDSRGGGFYGFVALLMFVYLEVIDIGGDIAGISASELDVSFLISFMIGNMIDAIMNTIRAALWPVWWLRQFGIDIQSGLLLATSYLGYRMVRPVVRRWLTPADQTTWSAPQPALAAPHLRPTPRSRPAESARRPAP